MRAFDYDSFQKASIPNDVVMYLSQINENKGKQQLFYKQKSDILEKLVQVAKIQSTASSNRSRPKKFSMTLLSKQFPFRDML